MALVTVNKKQVRPLEGSVVTTAAAGEALSLGQLVQFSSSGTVIKADATSAAGATGQLGLVVSGGNALMSSTGDVPSGEKVGVLVMGRVYVGESASLDVTKTYYLGTTAGRIADAAPTVKRPVGTAETTTILFFNPSDVAPTS